MLAKLQRFFMVLAFAAIAGCASGPTPQDIANADYGTAPSQEQAEERVKQYFNGVLKDPYSAQYQFSKVDKGYMVGSAFEGKPLFAGYILTTNVNAKNSFGGYTGAQTYQFLFQNGLLVKGLQLHPSGVNTTLF